MKTVQKQKNGFTLIEVMVSLTILAMLMTAVAFAFDAAVTNYQANQGIYETSNRARQALLRITNDLRTVEEIPLSSEEPNTQISFGIDSDDDGIYDKDVTYRFDNATAPGILYYDDNLTGNSYVLCDNVVSMTFNRTEHQIDRDNGAGGTVTITAVKDVRIAITVTDDQGEVDQTLVAAALIRKNL